MPAFLFVLRDVILLRRGPQDMPYSPRLLVWVCGASLLLQLAIASVLAIPGDALGAGLIGLAFNLGVEAGQACAVVLALPLLLWARRFKWEPRLVAIASALILGVGVVLVVERGLLA